MFESSFTFLKVRGIRIGAHWSWLFVFALVAWALGSQLFPRTYPGLGERTYWLMALVAAVVFFSSILAHELGHALTALREGMRIEGITLWLFGGVARFSSRFRSAGSEAIIALAGPAISLILTLAFAALAWVAGRAGWPETVRGVLDYLARINGLVLAFNLVPALPLDGGRVLRAWLWKRQDSFAAATVTAARAGRLFGMLLIGIGLLGFFTGADTGGLWIAFIGWFLLQAAQAEAADAMLRAAFVDRRVRDVMTPDPLTVPPDITVDELFDRAERAGGPTTFPVVEGDDVVGFVSLKLGSEVPARARRRTTVGEIMLGRDAVPTVDADAEVGDLLERLQSGPGRAVVTEDGRVAGLVATSDIVRALEVRQLRGELRPPTARPAGLLPWVVVGLTLLLAASLLYHPPVLVLSPGPVVDVAGDITIEGAETDRINGSYLLTSVALHRPTGLGAIYAMLHPERQVVSLSGLIPEGVEPDEYLRRQERVFQESRQQAAAAAAALAGMDVALRGEGAVVRDVVADAPADGRLREGDVIVAIDGRNVSLAQDVGRIIRSRPEGTRFRIDVERDGGTETVTVTSARLDVGELAVGIGVVVETRNFRIDLPFDIEFQDRPVGGPSAGLTYALAIYDLLEPADLARGRTVAASGTIDPGGDVGPVGGLAEKAAAAEDAGADAFLIPQEEVSEAGDWSLRVVGVDTLADAVRALEDAAADAA